MDVILKIIQVILSLSLLVLVHEFGHYITARMFRIRVEKFYLFFPPAILKFKPKKSDTEFGIGCIPLGGFCKISGMIDESLDKESLSRPPQPYIKNDDVIYGIEVSPLAKEIGFENGDRILALDGNPAPDNFNEIHMDMLRDQVSRVTVLRDGDTVDIRIDPAYMPAMLNTPGMFGIRLPIAVGSLPDTSINAGADLRQGDRFLTAAGRQVCWHQDLQTVLADNAGSTVELRLLRGADTVTVPVRVSSDGKIEVLLQRDISDITITDKEYSLLEAIPAGFLMTFTNIGHYIKELGLIFSPQTEAYKSVGSFIAIGSIFPSSWNWQVFWNITALLSIMLAVMNLLPIPALDGGHILFTLYEMITGRKPSDRFMEVAQMTGMFLLLMIMILAFGNDIIRLLR